ncbi:hypothetical protein MTO96_027769 [Rhipicephalus appendiculatus]
MDMPARSESTDESGSSGRNGSNDMLPAADTWGSWHVAGETRNRCLQFRVKNDHARVSCLLCATPMGSPRWLVPFVGRRLPRELAKRLTQASSQSRSRQLCTRVPERHPWLPWRQSCRRDAPWLLQVVMNGEQLYVANLGRTRVLLLRGGEEEPKLLTVEHSVDNADELARLARLGVDTDVLTEEVLPVTRCLGAHPRRRRPDGPDPVSNEPEFCGPLEVEPGWRLVFLSDGLCTALSVSGMANQEANRLVAKLASQPGTARQALSKLLHHCELPPSCSGGVALRGGGTAPAPVSDGRVDPYVDFTPLTSALEAGL